MEIIEQTHGESVNDGHLGGFAFGGDGGTYYPLMWEYLVEDNLIKSVLDVGCGRGYSAKFFQSLGCDVRGIDGSIQAKELSLIPDKFIHHDFSKGKIDILDNTTMEPLIFDLGWTCEFVEHVEEQYIPNFMHNLKNCAYVAMTFASPGQGGHHHVNENTQDYWIDRFTENGFRFDRNYTEILREYTKRDKAEREKIPNCPYFISHFSERGLFFENNEPFVHIANA